MVEEYLLLDSSDEADATASAENGGSKATSSHEQLPHLVFDPLDEIKSEMIVDDDAGNEHDKNVSGDKSPRPRSTPQRSTKRRQQKLMYMKCCITNCKSSRIRTPYLHFHRCVYDYLKHT